MGKTQDDAMKMQAEANSLATKLETDAKTIRKAAALVMRLTTHSLLGKNISEKTWGESWTKAEEILKSHGISVPNSAFLSWGP